MWTCTGVENPYMYPVHYLPHFDLPHFDLPHFDLPHFDLPHYLPHIDLRDQMVPG